MLVSSQHVTEKKEWRAQLYSSATAALPGANQDSLFTPQEETIYYQYSKACPEEVVTEQVPGVARKVHHDSAVLCSALRGCSSHADSCFCCSGSVAPNL